MVSDTPDNRKAHSIGSTSLSGSPELSFAWGTLKKIFVFVVIALAAVGIHKIVEFFDAAGIPHAITYTLTFLEYAILVADVIWFVRGLGSEIVGSLAALYTGGIATRLLMATLLIIVGAVLSPYLKSWLLTLLQMIPRQTSP